MEVFATVRKTADGEKLRATIPNLVPVMMDVEDRNSIAAAANDVASQVSGSGLDGLVNNAGIGILGPIEYASTQDLQKIFDINVFGQIAVTQAFLPSLRKKRGRVVNITSVGAHLAIPFGGLLNSSKSAFAALSDNMRLELHPFAMYVSTVEPGAISTPAVAKTLGDVEGVIASLPPEGRERYGSMLRNITKRGYEREKNGSPPGVVAQAVHDALAAARSSDSISRGQTCDVLTTLARVLPDGLFDKVRFRILGLPGRFGAVAGG